MRRSVAETLHIALMRVQISNGFLLGLHANDKRRNTWKSHVLTTDDQKLQAFLRLEIQDGSRKAPTQDYHGSGRVHLHLFDHGADPMGKCAEWQPARP